MHWKKELKKGQEFLEGKDLHHALKCFESAVTKCPVSANSGLEKSLYYLGLTLKKLGRNESALRCWHLGKKIKRDGESLKMIKKHSNRYGMAKINLKHHDEDKEAFIYIQVEKYLKTKRNKRFCSNAERDVILDLITTYWSEIHLAGEINHFTIDEKIKFFRDQKIVFPVADINSLEYEQNNTVIFTDFKEGKLQSMDDLCPCGSGILFSQCCGRIKSPEELEFGDF